ncbi:MAG: hypothetical protein QOJ83_1163 [Frankiales bacterium]|jgi:Flp pilus assembly protein TadB|nr:hypothetical protein [Frankiales bacterium]
MLSEAERRVLAEIEMAFRRDDARFVAGFDEQRIGCPRWRPVEVLCMAALLVAIVVCATGGTAVALACLCLTGCAAIVVALRRAANRRAQRAR